MVFLDVPMVQGILNSRGEVKSKQTALLEKEAFIKTIEGLIEKYKTNQEILKNLDVILPGDSDVPNLLVELEALAKAGGMMISDIKIASVETKSSSRADTAGGEGVVQKQASVNYQVIAITLVVKGDYAAFKNFLQAIETNIRLVDLESADFNATSEGAASLFDFNVVLKTYYYAK